MEREIQLVKGFEHLKEVFQNIDLMNEICLLNIVKSEKVWTSFENSIF